ncbi:TIGR04219 family outer membrane beta-barrel protein [Ferrimonas senticii]|uniref:TIGR04219 family outer membrane beta-barrel protein n=1 Tax=Ferrimonas senticii TaxID=394566 RepID=UPI000414F9A1|nr:TIGR04219 family outer membrane beta-barrel protein [Ferrimonas senticii]
MQSKGVVAALVAAALALPAQADVLAVKVGLDYFKSSADGSVAASDRDYDSESNVSVYAAFEHPIPLLPNAMLRYNDMSNSTNQTKVDLTNADLILYYELLDNPALELDLGIDYRIYDGEATWAALENRDLDEGALLGYVRGRFNIVGTGLFVYTDIVAGDIDDKKIHDYQLGAGYVMDFIPLLDLTAKVGYREHSFNVSGFNGISADITQDGWFVGAELAF